MQGDKIAWSSAPPNGSCDTDYFLLLVRRVRNNLFHGGKFNEHWFEPERSEHLISHSITILNKALIMNKDVHTAFLD